MSTKKENIKDIHFTQQKITLHFADGRVFSAPLALYPRLLYATAKERNKWKIIGNDRGIHWPQLDEDLSIEGLLHGIPSVEYRKPRRSSTKSHSPELRA
jgi:hypothetical protein